MLDKETREKAASASLSLSEGKRPAKKIAEIVWKRNF